MKFGPGKSGENCELYGSDSLYRRNTKVYDKEPAGAYERVAAADGKPAEGDEDHPCGGNQCRRADIGVIYIPHLIRINERYMINGESVSDDLFLEAFDGTKKVVDAYIAEGSDHPSYFEMLFLMGMYIFRKRQVDYVILETGLGGRLDATNVVENPLACIITSISRDHTEYLGDTILEIAGKRLELLSQAFR